MRKALSNIFLSLALVLAVSACSSKGRIIPKRTMVKIYEDMLMADQWLKDFPDNNEKADTTLFYERVFKKYGYSFKDYDASINYYIDRPDKFTKVFKQVQINLLAKSQEYGDLERLADKTYSINAKTYGYVKKRFDTDSQKWKTDTLLLWPLANPAPAAAMDTASLDSAVIDSVLNNIIKKDSLAKDITIPDIAIKKILDASRNNGVRPDKEQAIRKLPGDQPVAVPGQAM